MLIICAVDNIASAKTIERQGVSRAKTSSHGL